LPIEEIGIKRNFDYDHAGRLMTVKHQLNSEPEVTLVANEYNELGELVDKQLHSTDGTNFEQSVDYRYNIRGWLTSINDADLSDGESDYFGMNLGYNTDIGLNVPTADLQFNGNISSVKWSGDDEAIGYSYNYDPMNRLHKANHQVIGAGASDAFDVVIGTDAISGYDLNGNIKSLSRNTTGGTVMDDLGYTYAGNQLLSVSDAGDIGDGFKDGNTTGDDYDYDDNGNMTIDKNKGITSIEYNHLNLPSKVYKGDEYIKYIYDASGIKLAQEVYDGVNPEPIKRTDYIGEFIYEQEGAGESELAIIQHEEGRIVPNALTGAFEYQYHLKDHLGNTRLTFTTEPKIHEFALNYESDAGLPDDIAMFENVAPSSIIGNDAMDHTDLAPETTYTNSQLLNGASGSIVGSVLTIPVGKGDQINAEVYAKYMAATATSNPVSSIAGAVIGAITGSTGTANYEGAINGTVAADGSFINALGNGVSSTEPMAFINLMFLADDATDITSDQFSYGQVSPASNNAHAILSLPEAFEAPSSGFVVVYLSNESSLLTEVYFDDLKITVNESKIIQTDSYYPFGLAFNSYKRSTNTKNDFTYNGKELQDELDLGWMDYGARMYNADIGRWHNLDQLADKYTNLSPYQYVMNNPINAIDPDGRLIIFISGLRLAQGAGDQSHTGVDGLSVGGRQGIYNNDVFNYWSTRKNSFGRSASIDGFFKDFYNDRNTAYLSGSSTIRSQATDRAAEGKQKAKEFHKSVLNGDVTIGDGETIKIVSHSQGGAHSVGFADQLMSYKDKDGNSVYNIEIIWHITPHQPTDIEQSNGIPSVQISHPSDAVSSNAPFWLPNGGSTFGKIQGIDGFYGEDLFGGPGQPPAEGPNGNRSGHNVTDNYQYLVQVANDFCKQNPDKCTVKE